MFRVEGEANSAADYIFEPSKFGDCGAVNSYIIRHQLYKGIRDSLPSEMEPYAPLLHKATDNATDLRNQLKLTLQ